MSKVDFTNVKISDDLEQTLADPDLCLLFRQFLKDSYAGESLSFWATIESFKEITDQDELEAKASDIYAKFFSSDSEYELNVDSKTKTNLEQKLRITPLDNTLFDEVQRAVYALMETDCYSKFIASKQYKAFMEQRGKTLQESPTASPKPAKKSLLSSLFKKKVKDKDGKLDPDSPPGGRLRSASAAPLYSPPSSPELGKRAVGDNDDSMVLGISMSFGKKDVMASDTIRGLEMYRKRSASRVPMPQFSPPSTVTP